MARRRPTLMDPPVEDLLDKVDSKFTLVALSSKRARQINSYYNQLGDSMGVIVPPQVASVSGKPLTIAFEEIAASKTTYHRIGADLEEEEVEGSSDEIAIVAQSADGSAEAVVAAVETDGADTAASADAPEGDQAPDAG
jgi:DNA-directed RNA polymerase subunit omega